MKKCDHTSVGMLVWRDDKLLLIERKKFPFGYSPPSGHVDEDSSFEEAARRELEEEVGLESKSVRPLAEGRKENPCRRPGGNWHDWKVYLVEAEGEVRGSLDETKQVGFYDKEDLISLAVRTKEYLDGKITEEEWEKKPGLIPVWHEWLKELKII